MTQIRVCNAATPLKSWNFDHAGFLRCKTSVLRSCVLSYTPDELNLENMPAPLRFRKEVKLFVPEDEIAKDGVLGSLEGRPVSIDHIWQSTLGIDDVGNIAGSPTYDPISKMVFADILVTDPDAIKRITTTKDDPQRLVEQSAAYLMEVDWTPGVTEDGEEYDGIQRDIQYNHVALVGEGEGRAGKDVRILNKRSKQMSDELTLMKVGNSNIRVHNADVNSLSNEMDSKEDMIANLIDPDKFEKVKSDLAAANADIAEKTDSLNTATAGAAESNGKIDELRARIDELQDPKLIEKAANKMANEREEASKIYNSLKGKVDDSALQEAGEKAKSLQGVDLHRHVVTSVRAMNKKPDLSADDLESEAGLRGRFDTLAELTETSEKTTVSGAGLTKALNAKTSGGQKGAYSTVDARRKLDYDQHVAHVNGGKS